jgi:hypothetical protein
MVRWQCYALVHGGEIMPTLEIVSLEEAQGSGRAIPEYIALITEVPPGKAGKLSLTDEENPVTVRK